MTKIAFFYSFTPSNWISCQKIVANLLKSYKMIQGHEHKYCHFNNDTSISSLIKQIKEVKDWGAEKIVFLDHYPHPTSMLSYVQNEYEFETKKPFFYFHIYGDFSLYYKTWTNCPFLSKWNVHWICASERQVDYLKQLVVDPNSVSLCPFPVDQAEFFIDKNLRNLQRKAWNRSEDDKILIYTGRLSQQKKIHTLIKFFSFQKQKNPHLHLYLYGEFDNLGDPFVGKGSTEGQYFSKIIRLLKSLPQETQSSIHWMGGVPNKELKNAYNGADLLISLSVHHDEDYGMSIAEGLSCGLPAILTDWGGFSSFARLEIKEWVKLIKVNLGIKGRKISLKELNHLGELALDTMDFAPKNKISTTSLLYFSLESCASKLEKIHERPLKSFGGFTLLFHELVDSYNFTQVPFIDFKRNKITKIYSKVYGPYVRKN
jgi:glycosyltransferase involved in cell wall biosynthesis